MTETAKVGPIDGARAFGVMLGGPVVLAAAAVGSVVSTARALARREAPSRRAAAGAAATAVYAFAVRPWLLHWGATMKERWKSLPGGEDGSGRWRSTRAITIDAPVEDVWPWLAQLGQDRGGFYSYEWLENLAGCRMRNAEEIHPEWQSREIGETVYLHWATGLPVTRFEPNVVLGLAGWGSFVVEPLGPDRTRLFARGGWRSEPWWLVYDLLLELPHFVMERKMLLGIKERAERAHRPAAAGTLSSQRAKGGEEAVGTQS